MKYRNDKFLAVIMIMLFVGLILSFLVMCFVLNNLSDVLNYLDNANKYTYSYKLFTQIKNTYIFEFIILYIVYLIQDIGIFICFCYAALPYKKSA